MSNENIQFAQAMQWERIRWEDVRRARSLALACRVDRRLQEASEAASRPEIGLAEALRRRLRQAVIDGASPEQLFDVVARVHEQLDYLPKPTLPTGLRVFFDELLMAEQTEDVVIAPTVRAHWPAAAWDGAGADGDEAYPVAVIPQAELYNPLMWPLVGRQGAGTDGREDGSAASFDEVGPGMLFARGEALMALRPEEARTLWETGRDRLTSEHFPGSWRLARSLAEGILISAHRTGSYPEGHGEGAGQNAADNPVYRQLAAAYDEPAGAADILHAGWFHWYGQGLGQVLSLAEGGEEGWDEMGRLVNGIDDLLCRSLDVAAIHRFYASGGTKR